MELEDLKSEFESFYGVEIAKDGIKKLHQHYSRFDEDIIEEAYYCCIDQYCDANEAFEKLGGICYNKTVQYLEE